jgi:zinc protease
MRLGAGALLALLLAACGSGPGPGETALSGSSVTAAVDDPGSVTLPVDPAVTIGHLDNGLTYYLRSNDAPGGSLELRLVVAAGSLEQNVTGSGIAHFLEHMLFNGTADYPGNQLDDALQTLGMQVGADVNAYTSCDATVYGLTVSLDSPEHVEVAFDVLDQWATAATLDPDAVVAERGVVLEEYRMTETAQGLIATRFDEVYTEGSVYEGCDPIGTEGAIVTTDPVDLIHFYDRWYRPDLMAVVAVGDLAVDLMEREVIDRFSDNVARADSPEPRARQAGLVTGVVAEVVVHPDAPSPFVSIDYSLPDREPGTVDGERTALLDGLVSALVQSHLDEQVAAGNLPVVRPFATEFAYTDSLRFMGFNYVAKDEAASVTAMLLELRGLANRGFPSDSVERNRAAFANALDQSLAAEATRQDYSFAASYVAHFLGGADIGEVTARHARQTEMLESITADELSSHFATTFGEAAPLVLVVGHDPADLPSTAELEAAVNEGLTGTAGTGRAETTGVVDSLMEPPTAVDPVAVNRISTHGAVEFVYRNGASVIFTRSDISEGQVDLWAESQGGWTLLEPGSSALVDKATGAVDRSGAADLSALEVEAFQQSAGIWLMSMINETTEGFMGSARSTDLESLFALSYLRANEPRVDGPAFDEAVEAITSEQRSVEADPYAASSVQLADARYGGDAYFRPYPDASQVTNFSAEGALAMFESRLGDVDDLVIAVVGDTDEITVRRLADRYVGTLPAGPSDTWAALAPEPPVGVVTRTVSAGANEASAGFELLVITEVDPTEEMLAASRVLERILQSRLFTTLREEMGLSYGGGQVFIDLVEHPVPVAEVFVSVNGNPEGIVELHSRTLAEMADLAASGPDRDELERARSTVLTDLDFITNGDILERLIAWGRSGGEDSATLADRYYEVERISPDEIKTAAKMLLPENRRIEVFRVPEGTMP